MEAREEPGDLMVYRLDRLEDAVKTIGGALVGIDKSLNALTSLESRHASVQESVSRAFERLEATDRELLRVDTEFKRWFNRGVGVASVVSVLFLVIGGSVGSELNKSSESVAAVPDLTKQTKAQKRLNGLILRKLGVDPGMIDAD